MKLNRLIRIVILSSLILLSGTINATDTVPIPPLTMRAGLEPPGDWKAASPRAALDYAETEKAARQMEEAGKITEALILWERVLDRTTCTEKDREVARSRIKELRPKVQINADPEQARKWNVLVLIYKEIQWDREQDGTVTQIRRVFIENDYEQIGKSLAGFRDVVFEWSFGIILLDFDVVFIETPVTYRGRDFPVVPRDVVPEYKKVADQKRYDTVMAYVKFQDDEGPEIPRPWTAAIYGRISELGNAAYLMVPWGPDYPYRGEWFGEMELHEWLHQIDDIVHQNLGYPRGTTRSSDDGRTMDDSRTDGEHEYKRPHNVTTWVYFYKHLMTEHMTRQIWDEITIDPNPETKPGAIIQIE